MRDTLIQFTDLLVDASRFWERMRIPYNIVLAGLSMACWGREMLLAGADHLIAGVLVLTFFGIGANLLYCAAYPLDIAFQLTPWRHHRKYARWVLFAAGMLLASACALYVLLGEHMA